MSKFNYKFDEDKVMIYSVDENGEYHSYYDLPAVISLSECCYIWYNHGKIERDAGFGPSYIHDENIKHLTAILDDGDVTCIKYSRDHAGCKADLTMIDIDSGEPNGIYTLIVGNKVMQRGSFLYGRKVGIWKHKLFEKEVEYINGAVVQTDFSGAVTIYDSTIDPKNKVYDDIYVNGELKVSVPFKNELTHGKVIQWQQKNGDTVPLRSSMYDQGKMTTISVYDVDGDIQHLSPKCSVVEYSIAERERNVDNDNKYDHKADKQSEEIDVII
jgi:antitoxin component YwqK of YwqJK toxin-antitoxin module